MAISSRRIPVVEVIIRDELSRSLQQTQRRLRQELREPFRPLEQSFDRLGRVVGRVRSEFGSLLGLTGVSAFLGGGLVAGVAKLTQSLGELARSTQQIQYTAAAVGLTAKQFETLAARGQALGLTAQESRGQIANLAGIIDELVVKGPKASRFAEVYKSLGGPEFLNRVRQAALAGGSQAGIDAFLEGMSRVKDRRGQTFLANFAGLSTAWKDAFKIKESELGEIYEMSAADMRRYNLELLKLNISYDNVKKELAVALMPAATAMITAFDKFLQGPGGKLAREFGSWLGSLNINWDKVGDKIIAIINVATKFIETLDPIVQKMGGWPTIFIALGVALGVGGLGGGLKAAAAGLAAVAAAGGLHGLATVMGKTEAGATPGQMPMPTTRPPGAPGAAPTTPPGASVPSVPAPVPRPPGAPGAGPPAMEPLTSPIPRSTGPGGIIQLPEIVVPGKRSNVEFNPETAAPYRVAGGWQPPPRPDTSGYLKEGDTAELRETVGEVTEQVTRLANVVNALALNTDASGAGALAGLAGRLSAPTERLATLRGGGGGGGAGRYPRGGYRGGGGAPRRRPGGGGGGAAPDRSRTPPTTYQQSAADTQAIIAERKPFIEQLKDPETRSLAAWAMREEQHDPNLRSDPLEALINRAVADNARRRAEGLPPKTLKQYLTDGFYGPVNDYRRQHGRLPQASEQQLRDFDRAEAEVAGGSNRIRGRTDQGMKHEHKADPGGKFPVRGEYYSWHRGGTKYEKSTAAARAAPGQEVRRPDQPQPPQPPATGDAVTTPVTGLVAPVTGTFGRPGGISYYGAPRDRGHRRHSGQDWQAANGSRAVAMIDGVVTWSGYQGGYGGTIVVKGSDGIYRRYAVHGQPLVQRGQSVRQGQPIGIIAKGHLHYEEVHPTLPDGRPNSVYQEFEKNGNASTSHQRGTTNPASSLQLTQGTNVTAGDPLPGQKKKEPAKSTADVLREHNEWMREQEKLNQDKPEGPGFMLPKRRRDRVSLSITLNLRGPRGVRAKMGPSSDGVSTTINRDISESDATGGGQIQSPA